MFGGSLSLRHDAGRTQHRVCATLARGYKAGGFNIGARRAGRPPQLRHRNPAQPRARAARANADATLTGDVALFYMRRNDQQVPTGEQLVPGDPLSFVLYTDNAAGGENYGLEATLRWRPIAALLAGPARRAARDALHRLCLRRPRPRWPRAGARTAVPVRSGHWNIAARAAVFARVDFAGLDDFYFDDSHDERAPSRVLTHLKAGYSGNRWRAEVWVRNLFDRYYSQRGFCFGTRAAGFHADALRAGGRSAPCGRDGDVHISLTENR